MDSDGHTMTSSTSSQPAVMPVIMFTGSSEQDISHAKSFWKSLNLQPPLESRLVSSDIKQRLPVAKLSSVKPPRPPGGVSGSQEERFFDKVFAKIEEERQFEIRRIQARRSEHMGLLQKLKSQRLSKERHHNV